MEDELFELAADFIAQVFVLRFHARFFIGEGFLDDRNHAADEPALFFHVGQAARDDVDLARLAAAALNLGDDHNHAIAGQLFTVAEDDCVDIADAEAVDENVLDGVANVCYITLIILEFSNLSVVGDQHVLFRDAGAHGYFLVLEERSVVAFDWHEVLRPDKADEVGDILLLGVAAGVDVEHFGVDDRSALTKEAVFQSGD